jgi:hypothetical protein
MWSGFNKEMGLTKLVELARILKMERLSTPGRGAPKWERCGTARNPGLGYAIILRWVSSVAVAVEIGRPNLI